MKGRQLRRPTAALASTLVDGCDAAPTSEMGQTRKSGMTPVTSGLPQRADIVAVMSLFDSGPQVDIVAGQWIDAYPNSRAFTRAVGPQASANQVVLISCL